MNLFKIFGEIAVHNQDANKAIDETTDNAGHASEKLGKIVSGVGSFCVKAATVAATTIGAAATGIGVLTKKAVSDYAEYEQLVGGVETLFNKTDMSLQEYAASIGKSAEEAWDEWANATAGGRIVMNNAEEAFRTAGLSMNDYMETVTGFSASLISSLDGDTVKAAKIADMAIVDMSDNANKMGSSMESIQNAYSGFAKQNYTMLDNLKLGYGGTKEEMARLLEDAEKLSGIKYDISSFSDIAEAIHVIQENMGIAGTTSKEASSTIQGSIGMVKAAWTNFMTGMADPEQDFDQLTDNLVDSVMAAADNIVPRVAMTVPRIITGFSGLVQKLVPKIAPIIQDVFPVVINELIPAVSEAAGVLFDSFRENLPAILEKLLPGIGGEIGIKINTMFTKIAGIVTEALPNLLSIGEEAFSFFMNLLSVVTDIISGNLPEILNIIMELSTMLLPVLLEVLSKLLPTVSGIIMELLPAAMAIITAVLPSILEVARLLPVLAELIGALVPVISMILSLLVPSIEILSMITTFITGILVDAISFVIGFITYLIEEFVGWMQPYIDGILLFFEDIIAALKALFSGDLAGFFERFKKAAEHYCDNFLSMFGLTSNKLQGKVVDLIKKFREKFVTIKEVFANGLEAVKNTFKAPINGIIGMINKLIDAMNAIKFDIPSWIPEVGGKSFGFNLKPINYLAEGGILASATYLGSTKSGNGIVAGEAGYEAVIPLEKLPDLTSGMNNDVLAVLYKILELLSSMDERFAVRVEEVMEQLRFEINNREFGRLVKAV